MEETKKDNEEPIRPFSSMLFSLQKVARYLYYSLFKFDANIKYEN